MPTRRPPRKLHIFHMPEASWWESRRSLPKVLAPIEYSLRPCDDCPGNCCKTVVWLTTLEAVRIALTLAVPLEDVVARAPAAQGPRARTAMPIPLEDGEYQLHLRHRRDATACQFLIDVGPRGRCGAYALRPGTCRLYPYELSYDEELHTFGDPSRCPTPWLQDAAARRRVKKELLAWQQDLVAERELLDAWRCEAPEDRSWTAYQRFAITHFAPRFGKDPAELFPTPRRRAPRPT